jgi:hypothetical protein
MNLFKISLLILVVSQLRCTPPKDQSETKRSLTTSSIGIVSDVASSASKTLDNKVPFNKVSLGQVTPETVVMINRILANPKVKNLGSIMKSSVDSKLKFFQSNELLQSGVLLSNDIQGIATSIRNNSDQYADRISAVLGDQSLSSLNIEELSQQFIQNSTKDIPEFSQYVKRLGATNEEKERAIISTVVKNVTLTAQIEFFYALLNHPKVKENIELTKRIRSEFDLKRNAYIQSGIKTYDPKWITKDNGLLEELFPK